MDTSSERMDIESVPQIIFTSVPENAMEPKRQMKVKAALPELAEYFKEDGQFDIQWKVKKKGFLRFPSSKIIEQREEFFKAAVFSGDYTVIIEAFSGAGHTILQFDLKHKIGYAAMGAAGLAAAFLKKDGKAALECAKLVAKPFLGYGYTINRELLPIIRESYEVLEIP